MWKRCHVLLTVLYPSQVLMLSPLPEYNEGKIFCSYEQFDTDDITTLFEPVEVHEQIEVDYILPPSTELREIPSAAVRIHIRTQWGKITPFLSINSIEFGTWNTFVKKWDFEKCDFCEKCDF